MSQQPLKISCRRERWPLARPFVIARGAKTHADVVVAQITDHTGRVGRGECVPYQRYGETPQSVMETILSWRPNEVTHAALASDLPPGAARNALDCALWDYRAKIEQQTVAELIGRSAPGAIETCFTLSLDTPSAMAAAARAASGYQLLKLKLGGNDGEDGPRMQEVRAARPEARLLGDANEGWTHENLHTLLNAAAAAGFEVIEQPLPSDDDDALADLNRPVPVCADESHHTHADVAGLADRYDAINIKLDKAGGLSGALLSIETAHRHGLDMMIGCMVATSLAIAPAVLLGHHAKWIDLDGPAWLAKDREPGFHYQTGKMSAPNSGLWGTPT